MREDGSVEIYSDFILVDKYNDPILQCVDVEAGNHSFFFKMVKNSHLISMNTQIEELEFEFRKVKKNMRNRIGPSTMAADHQLSRMEQVTHRRVAPFYRLYTQMINFATFTIVAHRNLISLYNMG